ncbi:MAG: hypothetical protein SVM86_06640, partial [Candidatus Cloacimonadota bacterium]|nr:hypothetical protein [Candidatus Cloacimonadota bacterium]
ERITDDVEKVLNEVEEDLEEFTQKVSNPEFQQNLKDKVRENVEKLKFGLGVSRKTKEEVDERSRLKILQLLEDGKITTSEAERLLEAIGKNDE